MIWQNIQKVWQNKMIEKIKVIETFMNEMKLKLEKINNN